MPISSPSQNFPSTDDPEVARLFIAFQYASDIDFSGGNFLEEFEKCYKFIADLQNAQKAKPVRLYSGDGSKDH